jgi:hypothetical protein
MVIMIKNFVLIHISNMCIVFEDVTSMECDTNQPSLMKIEEQYNNHEFIPAMLSCLHRHPHDKTIISNSTSFYVKWFEKEDEGTHDTISVSEIIKDYVNHGSTEISTSKTIGILLHRQIEYLLNGMDEQFIPINIMNYYRACVKDKLLPWRTEMPIRSCSESRIVGVVDALFIETGYSSVDGILRLHLKDWKVSHDVTTCMSVYSLQLSLYKELLERFYQCDTGFYAWGQMYTSIKIISSELVVFHPFDDSYQLYNINPCHELVSKIIGQRKKEG